MPRKFLTLVLATALPMAAFSAASYAQEDSDVLPPPPPPPRLVQRDSLYNEGMRAMDESRWADAAASFDKEAAKNPDRSEAPLFWKAYSLEKLGKKDEANATCDQLRATRPASSWNGECMTLRVQSDIDPVKLKAQIDEALSAANLGRPSLQGLGPLVRVDRAREPIDPNDDIKLLALNSLMQQEPEKALPLLRTFLFSDKPIEVRRRALFVLGQSKAPGAQELLTEIATKNTDPALQRAAVQTLATMRGKQAAPDLIRIYRGSTDRSVKQAALSGLFITRDASGLVGLAREEKDLELKREIVSQLALMHDPAATAYMEELLK